MKQTNKETLLELTSQIVAAHVSNNEVSVKDLQSLIHNVHNTLTSLNKTSNPLQLDTRKPAVPVEQSIGEDYIICLEDGKKLKMLKRHLKTSFNMTPEEYRERWGLPIDYPMVAPNYAEKRSSLAKEIGLGKRGR